MIGSRRQPSARGVLLLPVRRDINSFARAAMVLVLFVLVGSALTIAPARALSSPNSTKAEMLWNIAKFVQWPEVAAPAGSTKGQIVFTILGEDDLAGELAALLSSKTINGRPVFVRFARRPQDAKGSQILYIASSEMPRIDDVLAAVGVTPVLTVADAPGFAAHGGMVGFSSEGERLRFEINLGHVERNGLKISAKLLALARVVDATPSETR